MNIRKYLYYLIFIVTVTSCSTNPYKASEKIYNTQMNTLKGTISEKAAVPLESEPVVVIDSVAYRYNNQLINYKDTLSRTILNPIDWENKFNLYQGSGLGLAHGLSQVGGFRPSNKDEHFKNLYYVGASTTPGTGLPMVVISSKLVSERINHEHGIIQQN